MSLWLATGCAPPPLFDPVDAPEDTAAEAPSIAILYPEAGQRLVLDPTCALLEPIVVDVRGIELVASEVNEDGQGHWHGGPDLDVGYCMAFGTWCAGRGTEPEPDELVYTRYDGRARSEGLITLRVQLQTNRHEPIEVDDQVEVLLVAPDGGSCP